MPKKKANGSAKPEERISERQRIEDGIRQLHARLQDVATRERYQKELREFLAKRTLLTRFDVTSAAHDILPTRFGKRARLADLAEAETGGPEKKRRWLRKAPATGKIGIALRKWREEHELSPLQAAKKVGVHTSTISAWERGASSPTAKLQAALLKITGLPENIFN